MDSLTHHLHTSVWILRSVATTSLKRVSLTCSVQTLLPITLTCREQASIIISTFSHSTTFSILRFGGITLHGEHSTTARTGGTAITVEQQDVNPLLVPHTLVPTLGSRRRIRLLHYATLRWARRTRHHRRDPFRNSLLSGKTDQSSYAFYSAKRAIDSISDPEVVEMNVASVPGITNKNITDHLISTCETRADALAVIDLPGGYETIYESTSGEQARLGSTDSVISNLKTRGLNTSYACAFHPWVQVDTLGSGNLIWMPPSVAALGTFSSNDRKNAPWFSTSRIHQRWID